MDSVNDSSNPTPVMDPTPVEPVLEVSSSKLPTVFGVVVVLVLAGIGFYLGAGNFLHKDIKEAIAPSPSPISLLEGNGKMAASEASSGLIFYNDGELWKRENGVLKQVTQTERAIATYSVSKDGSLLAYISGELISNENGYESVTPRQAFLQDLKTGKLTKIHEIEPTQIEGNSEYVRTLRAVEIAPSGKKIAVTSSNALWMYDIQTQKLDEIFSKEEIPERGMVYSYYNPVFSKDETKMILGVGYYEGGSQMAVDLTTKQTRDLQYSSYTQGKRIIEHIKDNTWLLLEWGSIIDDSPSTKVYEVNLDTNAEIEVLSIPEVSTAMMIPVKDGYVLSGQTLWHKTNEQGVEYSGNDQKIMLWNRKTNEVEILIEAPQNSEDGKSSHYIGALQPIGSNSNDFYMTVNEQIYGPKNNSRYYIQKFDSATRTASTVENGASLSITR